MNRRLLDPFQSVQLPEVIEEYLEHGTPVCLAFNRRGTLLAVGTAEGKVVLWDFETRGLARVLAGHSRDVTSVCWSRNGRYLASGALDSAVILWDVLQGEEVARVELGSAVARVSLSARPPYRCVVSLAEGPPQLVPFMEDSQQTVPLLPDEVAGGRGSSSAAAAAAAAVKSEPGVTSTSVGGGRTEPTGGTSTSAAATATATAGGAALALATFTRGSEMLLVAHCKGSIAVMDASTLRFLDVIKIPGSARVVGMHLNRKGTLLLANCSDRVLRLFEVGRRSAWSSEGHDEAGIKAALAAEGKASTSGSQLWPAAEGLLTPVRDFQNTVERMSWRSACLSNDDEHVVAAFASRHGDHHLYIWNRVTGRMERVLEGPAKEGVREVLWHPLRSLIVSMSMGGATAGGEGQGRVFIWSKLYTENWSAFAPEFEELDENAEYVEQEDEYDWNMPAHKKSEADAPARACEEDVDVTTVVEDVVFSSDGEDEDPNDQLHYLPAEVQPEEGEKVEDGQAGPDSKAGEDGTAGGDAASDEGGDGGGSDADDGAKESESLGASGPRKRKVKWNDDWADPSKVSDDGDPFDEDG